ncbi:MAG: molybdopterin molybdotransferase MoeA [Pseudomonadota bacterium]
MADPDALPTMISVETAREVISNAATAMSAEDIGLDHCTGRVLADAVYANHTQPPFSVAAMDGYAVRFTDMDEGVSLRVIGEAPAGTPFGGVVERGQAVRIFTGAPVPTGTDHILIQEEAIRDGDTITVTHSQVGPRHIRPSGLDFSQGECLAEAGSLLNAFHGAIFAAGNVARLSVVRRPRVMIFTNGDELVPPGTSALTPGQIIDANPYGLSPLISAWGGAPTHLGCAPDRLDDLRAIFENTCSGKSDGGADIIVPVGGASVGDHDYMKAAFAAAGGERLFSKVAVKPGKPTWFGRIKGARGPALVLGLPGNPASALVTAHLFLRPLIRGMLNSMQTDDELAGIVTTPIAANGRRETFLRARAAPGPSGWHVTPAANQDSALLLPFARCNALVRRYPDAAAAAAGASIRFELLR